MSNEEQDIKISPSDIIEDFGWGVAKAQDVAYEFADKYDIKVPLELIRFGENAVFKSHDEKVIVRVHRSNDNDKKIVKEVEVAKSLKKLGFPSNRLTEAVGEQPIVINDCYVTAWDFIEEAKDELSWHKVGENLKDFHKFVSFSVKNNNKLDLVVPDFNPFKRMGYWLTLMDGSNNIKSYEKEFLRKEYLRLKKFFIETNSLEDNFSFNYMHGDFYIGNILNAKSGPIFIDFELLSKGVSHWDLVLISASNKRFNLSDEDYKAFCEGYGYDVREWKYYENAIKIFELNAILWLVQNIDLKTHKIALNEFRHRIKNWTVEPNNDKWLISKEL